MADTITEALEELVERTTNGPSDTVLVINGNLRTIKMPKDFFFGVYNDANVLSVPFVMPRYYADNDLSEFSIRVNYVSATGVGGVYDIVTPTVNTDTIEFEWLTGRGVFLGSGDVTFNVCLRKIVTSGSSSEVVKEYNTTVAKASVLAGLEVDDPQDPAAYSVLAKMEEYEASAKSSKNQASAAALEASTLLATASTKLDTANTKLDEATSVIARAEQLYGTPLVAATVAGMTDHDKIYVYTGSETNYTAGNWYYWNGSAWTSGGVYNSSGVNTDTTLAVSGMPADAKKTGDEIVDAKTGIKNLGVVGKNVRSTSFEWSLKHAINSSGSTTNSNGVAYTTGYINVSNMPVVINETNDVGYNTTATTFYIHEYNSSKVWLRRIKLTPSMPYSFSSDCTYFRISYGYANATGVTITNEILTEYFAMRVISECAIKTDVDNSINDTNSALTSLCRAKKLDFIQGSIIYTNGSTADITDIHLSSSGDYGYTVADCEERDIFIISGTGADSARLWAFIDSSGNVLSRSNANATLNQIAVVAPPNAAKIIINANIGSLCFKGAIDWIDKVLYSDNLWHFSKKTGFITSNNVWNSGANSCIIVPLKNIAKIKVTASKTGNAVVALLSSDAFVNSQAPSFTETYPGRIVIVADQTQEFTIGNDEKYLYIYAPTNNIPKAITFNGFDEIFASGDALDIKKSYQEVIKEYDDLSGCYHTNTYIASNKKWMEYKTSRESAWIEVPPGIDRKLYVEAQSSKNAHFAFLKTKKYREAEETVTNFCEKETGRRTVTAGSSETVDIPLDCKYILVLTKSSGDDYTPKRIVLTEKTDYECKENAFDLTKENAISASRNVCVTANGHDIPQNLGVLNAYKRAHQFLDIEWTALSTIPGSSSATAIPAGDKTGIVYSSVKEYSKFVGWNVSLKTFMTAVHNPYSLMYTEDTLGSRSTSEYWITYHGTNCGAYFGSVCNIFALYAVGAKIPWTTEEFEYIFKKGYFRKSYDQSVDGIRLMDIIWEPGHANIIIDIQRNERGEVEYVWWAESVTYWPKATKMSRQEVTNRLQSRTGVIYYYTDLYKNTEYTPSEFVNLPGETETIYTYNDDICTYAGDYACFNSSDEVWINYDAGSYSSIELYKGDQLISTTAIDASEHKIKMVTDGCGKYKARLTGTGISSDYTYFEIVDTTVSCNYQDEELTVIFSSTNGIPVYAQMVDRNGSSFGTIELSDQNIRDGAITFDPFITMREQHLNKSFDETVFIKVFFAGDYGVVCNAYLDTGIYSAS